MTTYPPFYDFESIDAWLAACDAIAATDPAVQAAAAERRARLAREQAQHEARMAKCDRLTSRTDATLTPERRARIWAGVKAELDAEGLLKPAGLENGD